MLGGVVWRALGLVLEKIKRKWTVKKCVEYTLWPRGHFSPNRGGGNARSGSRGKEGDHNNVIEEIEGGIGKREDHTV